MMRALHRGLSDIHAADRTWFAENPTCAFRLRPVDESEAAALGLISTGAPQLPAGVTLQTVVPREAIPGLRDCRFIPDDMPAGPNLALTWTLGEPAEAFMRRAA